MSTRFKVDIFYSFGYAFENRLAILFYILALGMLYFVDFGIEMYDFYSRRMKFDKMQA
jgi:hypothetical protein